MSAVDLAAVIDGYQGTALAYAAVRLQLPDRMGSGSWLPKDVARETGGRPDELHRLLRGLTVIGVCDESGGRYTVTESGRALCAGDPSGLREQVLLAVEQYWAAWTQLSTCVESGGTGFSHAFGIDVWEYRQASPESGATFDAWLAKHSAAQSEAIIGAVDFVQARRVADIGGGVGGLMLPLLAAYPQLTGIVFDQPHVIAGLPTAPRLELVAGNFFDAVPVDADVYLLKSVVHDWDDDSAVAILRNCRAAMAADSRLVLIERVLPASPRVAPATVMLDLHMMAVTGGRERTLDQLEALVTSAGLRPSRTTTCDSGHTVIEAVLV